MKKFLACTLAIILLLSGCSFAGGSVEGTQIKLSDKGITVDGEKISGSKADAHTVVHITKAGKYILSGKLSL